MNQTYEIPIWRKYTLTVEEAAAYFRIGENKLRNLINENNTKVKIVELVMTLDNIFQNIMLSNYLNYPRKMFSLFLSSPPSLSLLPSLPSFLLFLPPSFFLPSLSFFFLFPPFLSCLPPSLSPSFSLFFSFLG